MDAQTLHDVRKTGKPNGGTLKENTGEPVLTVGNTAIQFDRLDGIQFSMGSHGKPSAISIRFEIDDPERMMQLGLTLQAMLEKQGESDPTRDIETPGRPQTIGG